MRLRFIYFNLPFTQVHPEQRTMHLEQTIVNTQPNTATKKNEEATANNSKTTLSNSEQLQATLQNVLCKMVDTSCLSGKLHVIAASKKKYYGWVVELYEPSVLSFF